jgi:hypothetical protein
LILQGDSPEDQTDLEREIGEFVTRYNERRYHKSLNNLTPEEVWSGRRQAILDGWRKIKERSLKRRKQLYFERKTA